MLVDLIGTSQQSHESLTNESKAHLRDVSSPIFGVEGVSPQGYLLRDENYTPQWPSSLAVPLERDSGGGGVTGIRGAGVIYGHPG